MSNIDWAAVVAPRKDQYGANVALEEARKRGFLDQLSEVTDPTIMDGRVQIRNLDKIDEEIDPRFSGVDPDHPNVRQALDWLASWPEVYEEFARLVHTWIPLLMEDGAHHRDGPGGSCGGGFSTSRYSFLYATVTRPFGAAEGMVHELAHHKLLNLGVPLEERDSIVMNDPNDLYESPIRKDKNRPMQAVLQAHYSYIYITQLDLIARERDPEIGRQGLSMNLHRIEEGLETCRNHLEIEPGYEPFIEELFRWNEELIEQGRAIMGESA